MRIELLMTLLVFPSFLCAQDVPIVSAGLVGEGIMEFIPRDYDPEITPSLILAEEPEIIGNMPDGWNLVPCFSVLENDRRKVSLPLHGDISLYGGGEVTGPLLRNGKKIKLWNTDTGAYSVEDGIRLYQSHPWVMGVRNDGTSFGILFDSSWKAEIVTDDNEISYISEGGPCRVYVIDRENPREVLKGLAELTGTMEMPPRWALGYHQCRFSYDSEKRVREIAEHFRKREIPCDVIWMDIDYMDGYRIFTFNPERFPDPRKLNDDLHKQGFRAVYMIDPGPKVDKDYFVYRSGCENDIWVKWKDGKVYEGKCWPGYCSFPDFTMPSAREWWSDLYKDFLNTGIDGVWNDMNEPAITTDEPELPEELRTGTMPYELWHRGGGNLPAGPHLLYHNAYGRLMTEATRDGFLKVYPDRRPFVLTRANLLGGQRYAATWTGDNWAGWEHLKLSVPMSLTLGLSAQPFSGPDIGGFLNNTEPDLWANWIGFGVFFPFVRGHACAGTNDKEPWAFGKEIENSSKIALERRYRLLPYIYTKFYQAHMTGIPVMQPLFLNEPDNPQLREEEQAFMLGEDLLVIPAFAKNVVMPKGIWETLNLVEGDDSDIYQAQLKIRGGSIIPAGKIIQNTNENSFDPLTLFICLDDEGKAEGKLYWDEGDGWGFRNGDFYHVTINAEEKGDGIQVKIVDKQGYRDLDKDISAVNIEIIKDGKTYLDSGNLSEGINVKI